MTARPVFAPPHAAAVFIAAVLATAIAIGVLTVVSGLFLDDGTPFEQLVVAERACAHYAFVSEREACANAYVAASRGQSVASR